MIVISQIRRTEARGQVPEDAGVGPAAVVQAVIGLPSIAVLMMFNAAGRAQLESCNDH